MDEIELYLPGALGARQTEAALEKVNRRVQGHGLVLQEAEIQALAKRREEVLQSTGRVEFGEGILPKLVFLFCDSPYIPQQEYAATLDALQACFYHFKNETGEAVGDDDLLEFMKTHFDGDCHGSVEYLEGTLVEHLARGIRLGGQEGEPPDEEGEEGGDEE